MNKHITEAIKSIVENKLPDMKENFNRALVHKAAAKLEEMKSDMGAKFFK